VHHVVGFGADVLLDHAGVDVGAVGEAGLQVALGAAGILDEQQGQIDGLEAEEVMQRITDCLPDINKIVPGYAQIRKIEFLSEDFERTPKRSIKRYLYQR
jgi:long-chain acyl-CoA synthetase